MAQEYVADGNFEPIIEKLFASPEVDYLQVNSTTAGCFTFRIERGALPTENPADSEYSERGTDRSL
jgi:hypothetical protein